MEWQPIDTVPINLDGYQPQIGDHECMVIGCKDGSRIVVEFNPTTGEPVCWLPLPERRDTRERLFGGDE